MAQTATMTSRELVLARRRAMSTTGKAALNGQTAPATATPVAASPVSAATGDKGLHGQAASKARRAAMSSGGKAAIQSKDRTRGDDLANTQTDAVPATNAANGAAEQNNASAQDLAGSGAAPLTHTQLGTGMAQVAAAALKAEAPILTSNNVAAYMPVARKASLARREAMSTGGKANLQSISYESTASSAPAAPATTSNPNEGRDVARAMRAQRSQNGAAGQEPSRPCGRQRPGAAEQAPWKVGASETTRGQTVTGTMTGRTQSMTGNESSTCRPITGTEYAGTEMSTEFCETQPAPTHSKVEVNTTSRGNTVSGNKMGRDFNMTGNEFGACNRVTGNEYIGSGEAHTFCGEPAVSPHADKVTSSSQTRKGKNLTGDEVGRSDKVTGDEHGAERDPTGTQYAAPGSIGAPNKVGKSDTLRGGGITGTMVGRGKSVTGDEPGSCKDVTGNDYIGQEQYSSFCGYTPRANDHKSGVSYTATGGYVTGTMTGRSMRVTGNEPGSCKTVSGTPYASADQYETFCDTETATLASARRRKQIGTPGLNMTGQQPGVGGVMTGAAKGACQNLSGTPYVGGDQFVQACPDTAPAESRDGSPWNEFSVNPPSGGAQRGLVTGNQYESGHISGSFGKGEGKLTGTEEARFDFQPETSAAIASVQQIQGREVSRISGEGQDAGLNITGDDWDRNKHVTGTEGLSAKRRNPTLRNGDMRTMAVNQKRNERITEPTSKVTGGSGNTDKGSLITYSGGARG